MPKNMNVIGCRYSEKYDGVQGIWDGHQLTTKTGNRLAAPKWWLKGLPKEKLLGELWTGWGDFTRACGIVCSRSRSDEWRYVKFMIFPGQENQFSFDHIYSQIIVPERIMTIEEFNEDYETIIALGGEGIVITTPDGKQYKLKPVHDDEGVVIDHIAGAGRYEGLCNGVVLRLRNGRVLRVSAGMTDALRKVPPEEDSIVRFYYNGFTSKGLPRYARLSGIRAENSLCF